MHRSPLRKVTQLQNILIYSRGNILIYNRGVKKICICLLQYKTIALTALHAVLKAYVKAQNFYQLRRRRNREDSVNLSPHTIRPFLWWQSGIYLNKAVFQITTFMTPFP